MNVQITEASLPKLDELSEVVVDQASEVNLSSNTLEEQTQQENITANTNARFGPSCNRILSETEIVKNIIERSKIQDRRRWLYLLVVCIPLLITMGSLMIKWAVMNCNDDCNTSTILLLVVGLLGVCDIFVLIWVIYYGANHYCNGKNYELLRNSVRFVIKLEGEQWTRYVNYLYGPERTGFSYVGRVGAVTFCCCRASHYRQMIERGYGYIILCKYGFLLDEMFCVVRNRTHLILKVTYVLGMGLRTYVLRTDSKTVVSRYDSDASRAEKVRAAIIRQTVPLDIYLPNTLTIEAAALLGLQIQHGI